MTEMFSIGQLVCVRADPARQGPVIALLAPIAGLARYRVFHSPQEIHDYDQEQLAAVRLPSMERSTISTTSAESRTDADTFRAQLTAARLSHPQVNNLYALHAARIQHIPFQFKPLLRLLRAELPRLLIADEVGVGKTIEAGLILKELQTRQQVDNVLVVCPKPLVAKWRTEMRRFDEDFIPLTADTLRYCLNEAHLDGAWPAQYSRAIVHLELLRMDEYLQGAPAVGRRPALPGLLTLDPPPRFSLLIVDEAHHVRNPETSSHELARFLCDVSEAAIFLSATPLHLGSQNLFTLLHLLRPDVFADKSVFAAMMEPNRHVTAAMRHIRRADAGADWPAAARTALEAAAATSWGQQVLAHDPRFEEWHARLGAPADFADADRVRCLRDLEEVHSLAHIMNRTRRRDIGRFTIREPHTVSVPFTPEQQRFYDALIAFRQDMLLLRYTPGIVRLIADMLERQAASCLPAIVHAFDGFLRTGRFSTSDLSDDPEAEGTGLEVGDGLPPELTGRMRELRTLASSVPARDPKLEQLLRIVEGTMSDDGPGKVLVFSFFLHTLDYLNERLRNAGIRAAVITGQVADADRETLRDRFRMPRADPYALDVLLSSEVGCEGLDYEFCSRLVNYDIPWNPMRIEQRIGRIDRFGQLADKVLIYNFITPGTVEERIFFRCFERLGVFHDTVGDLDEVLGEVVQELARAALSPTLTHKQAEEQARQTADNAICLLEEQRRLEQESSALFGLDQGFAEEVDTIQTEGRFISAEELHLMISRFLREPEFGGRLVPDERAPQLYRLRLRRDARLLMHGRVRALPRQDRQTIAFGRWLDGAELALELTFDQRTACERHDVAFITPVHPLARIAVAHWSAHGQSTLLAGHLLIRDPHANPGRYLFICDLWETLGVKPELRLVSLAWDLDCNHVLPDDALNFMRLLDRATTPTASPDDWLPPDAEAAFHALDEAINERRTQALRALRGRNDLLVSRKLASLHAHYRNRLNRLRGELARGSDERIIRMKEAELARVERDYRHKREEIDARRDADIIGRRIAVGLLEVDRGE